MTAPNEKDWVETLSLEALREIARNLASLPLVLFRTDSSGTFLLSVGGGLKRLGLRPGEAVGKSVFDMYPQTRDAFVEATSAGEGQFFASGVNGTERWSFVTHLAADRETNGAIGVSVDVSSATTAEERLKESEARFKALAEASNEAIVLHDKGIVIEANDRMLVMLGVSRAELILSSIYDYVAPQSLEISRAHANDGEGSYRSFMRRKDGREFAVEIRYRTTTYRGRSVRVVAARDLSYEEHAKRLAIDNLTLRQAAVLDKLTGLGNRKLYEEHFHRRVRDAQVRGEALTVLMLDIDHFKAINDRFGHAAGDAVLKQLGEVLRSLRGSDEVARIGGEEFCILLAGVAGEQALAIAERIRKSVRDCKFPLPAQTGNVTIPVTTSVGVASAADYREPDQVFKAADDALYRAKTRGRNRVET